MVDRLFWRCVLPVLLAGIVGLAGCSGSSSSNSGGGAAAGGGNKVVRGNISSVGDGIGFQQGDQPDNQLVRLLEYIVADANAADIDGIEVCIQSVCTITDGTGSFILDLGGVPGGIYPISFSVNGLTYTAEVEVMDDALVVLENVSISDDGVVRINNIRVVLIDQPDDDIFEDDDDLVDDFDDDDSPAPQRVAVCHKPGTPAEKVLVLPEPAVNGHLGHGDVVGDCPKGDDGQQMVDGEDDLNEEPV